MRDADDKYFFHEKKRAVKNYHEPIWLIKDKKHRVDDIETLVKYKNF